MNELKPCPFCGSETLEMDKEDGQDFNSWYITCYNCDCQGVSRYGMTRDEAIKAWNMRAEDQP